MYILLAIIAACAAGVAIHFALPGRETRGVAVAPAVTTATAAAVYTLAQWAGLAESSVWLWLASLGGAVVVGVAVTLVLTSARTRSDAAQRAELGI
ncbi:MULTISPECIES: hypothetical protein [Microbacterium]|uniref:Uncharacterized protein n=1 Tax=Microbacterium resistens TaxID=156977 RepID=A0ABY3RW46_9MICO|nr:hypothetical protein [Microbacterium resistens]MBW1638210.1 hypothetical protein [Microbacterium resistens]MDA4894986.1 hypothetical protein [Streptomyces sp. MS2A]UGS26921.1 hypothetical protein K8F61_01445 [Microbacterium resistens]